MTACVHAQPAATTAPVADAPPAKKRSPPPPPPAAITAAGVRYSVVIRGLDRGLDQSTGYIAATAAASGRELWTLKVYATRTDPEMEQDKQDLYITKLSLIENRRGLLVTDERGGRYHVDLASRAVRKLN